MRVASSTLAILALSCAPGVDTPPLDGRQFGEAGAARFTASPRLGLTAELTAHGLRASTRLDTVALATVAYGGVELVAVDPVLGGCALGEERAAPACLRQVELNHGALTEWWVSGTEGLEHGWTLRAPPKAGPVTLKLTLAEGELGAVDADGVGASLVGSTGGAWRYDGLVAWDADGARVPARMVGTGGQLVVEVDAAGARWPLTVDPALWPETKITMPGGEEGDAFGITVSGAGDLNADGYDDLVVGAWGDRHESGEGAAHIYYGSETGVDATLGDVLIASASPAAHWFAWEVSGAGDLNADGYDDLVIAAPGTDELRGSVYVYYGGETGVEPTSEQPITTSDGESPGWFGWDVSGGDVNGDGFDDLLVGAIGDELERGAAYVYFGSPTGLDPGSEYKLTPSNGSMGDSYGLSVSVVGDINGDGFADVAVGAAASGGHGSTFVYDGSADGIESGSEWRLFASDGANNDYFGASVSGAGDLNADGYADLVVGAYLEDARADASGSAYVYYGTTRGIKPASEDKLSASDGGEEHRLGASVSGAGDLDADGFDDLVLGAYGDDGAGYCSGSAYVYFGSAARIDHDSEHKLTPVQRSESAYFGSAVAGAGDLDGDGFHDLVVGAYRDVGDGLGGGAVYVYSGACRYTGDADGDGHECGVDCDDNNTSIHPGAADTWYDGIDSDCAGNSDYDADADGHDSNAHGGDDCDDANAAVLPGATEVSDDGIDQDCDGEDAGASGWGETDDKGEDDSNPACGGCATNALPGPALAAWFGSVLISLRRRPGRARGQRGVAA